MPLRNVFLLEVNIRSIMEEEHLVQCVGFYHLSFTY